MLEIIGGNKKKRILLEILKGGEILSVDIEPESRVEDVLINLGIPDYNVGFQAQGPYLPGSYRLFENVDEWQLLVCVCWAN